MIDIKVSEQLVPHDPDNGIYGDCYRATLATLLGVDTEQVPHFLHDNCDALTFNTRVNDYLAQFRLVYMSFNAWDIPQWKKDAGISIPIYHEIADDSPRFSGTGHAVVGKDGEVFHDPHPTKLGLPKVTDKRTIGFLVQAIPDSRNKTICDLRAQLAAEQARSKALEGLLADMYVSFVGCVEGGSDDELMSDVKKALQSTSTELRSQSKGEGDGSDK